MKGGQHEWASNSTSVNDECALLFEVLHRLAQRLPDDLSFHTFEHTAEVVAFSTMFAKADNRSEREIELVRIAATFHDVGFLVDRLMHEELGAELASALMLSLGTFSQEECEMVRLMILDTQVVSESGWCFDKLRTPLSQYLCDADVANFGRDTYLAKLELVRLETSSARDTSFYLNALAMLDAHHWHSAYAKQHLQAIKESNRIKLMQAIEECEDWGEADQDSGISHVTH